MINFWKEHKTLRVVLLTVLFVAGMALIVLGWKLTGQLKGLGLMLVGLALLIAALWLYNQPFADPAPGKKK